MCVIALQLPGLELSGNKFRNCWSSNPDGGGYCFIEDGKVVIRKGYFDMKSMLTDYRKDVDEHPDSTFIIHFRIKTTGKICERNTHPHRVRDDLAMAHNGHITGYGNNKKSDTLQFAIKILRQLPDGWEDSEAALELIEGYLSGDKMVLLKGDGSYAILNEHLGEWDKHSGLWFSNATYKKKSRQWGTKISWDPTHSSEGTGSTATAITVNKEYTGDDCWYCHGILDEWDAAACKELGAFDAVCFDCLCDQGIANEAYDTGILLRPVSYLDSNEPEKEDLDEYPKD
jgi:hypothetical protein